MYVSEVILCWRNFYVFSLVTNKCEKLVKTSPFFQMSAILKFDFQKKKQLHQQLQQLHKYDIILHVTITFSLKQGETRSSEQAVNSLFSPQ